jgi:hypothetical protein
MIKGFKILRFKPLARWYCQNVKFTTINNQELKMKKHIFFGLLFISIFISTILVAQPLEEEVIPSIIKKLNLTNIQADVLNDLIYDHKKSSIEERKNIELIRLEIEKILKSGKIDPELLQKRTEELIQIESEQKLSRTNLWLDIYIILDEKQQAIWSKSYLKFNNPRMELRRVKHQRRMGKNFPMIEE